MVEERGEPFLPIQPCSCPYTVQSRGHAYPARCPARVGSSRVLLGPLPWLRRLRPRLPDAVRRLPSYYGGVITGFGASPSRCGPGATALARREISRFPGKERTHMLGSTTAPGRPGARDDAPGHVAFRSMHSVGAPGVVV